MCLMFAHAKPPDYQKMSHGASLVYRFLNAWELFQERGESQDRSKRINYPCSSLNSQLKIKSTMPRKDYKFVTVPDKVFNYFMDEWKEDMPRYQRRGVRSFVGYLSMRLSELMDLDDQKEE